MWVSGSQSTNQNGNYGTLGVESSSNTPGSRQWPCGFYDTSRNLAFMFGGFGRPATNTLNG